MDIKKNCWTRIYAICTVLAMSYSGCSDEEELPESFVTVKATKGTTVETSANSVEAVADASATAAANPPPVVVETKAIIGYG